MVVGMDVLERFGAAALPFKTEGITTGELVEFVTPVVIYIICSLVLLAMLPRQRID